MQLQSLDQADFAAIRLIATDMDGTLTQNGKFTPTLLSTLQDLAIANIPVIIVTGRSAGWVNGIVEYLPIVGAIAENGGLYYHSQSNDQQIHGLVAIDNIQEHRQKLATMFAKLQTEFPQIQESGDNRFRLTDWTFDVLGLQVEELRSMHNLCLANGFGFTYSTVQCHIRSIEQDKAVGLVQVLQRFFPDIRTEQVVTIGDSPNDASLFNPQYFPCSVGVANLVHYLEQIQYQPAYITPAAEVEGFQELVAALCRSRNSVPQS